MMIGPSAPNGPPLPIEMADDSGFKIATLAESRLCPNRIASIASGMPCPRILGEPKRAIRPISRLPTTGTTITRTPDAASAISAGATDQRPNQAILAASAISLMRIQAATTAPLPTTSAIAASRIILASAL